MFEALSNDCFFNEFSSKSVGGRLDRSGSRNGRVSLYQPKRQNPALIGFESWGCSCENLWAELRQAKVGALELTGSD